MRLSMFAYVNQSKAFTQFADFEVRSSHLYLPEYAARFNKRLVVASRMIT